MFYLLVLFFIFFGFFVIEVYVVDKDIGMNVVIVYSIIGRRGFRFEFFRIDFKIGNIILEEVLL